MRQECEVAYCAAEDYKGKPRVCDAIRNAGIEPQLKPCAHCGSTPKLIEIGGGFQVICDGCGMRTCVTTRTDITTEAWNRRVTP
jgi:hypothetical protein